MTGSLTIVDNLDSIDCRRELSDCRFDLLRCRRWLERQIRRDNEVLLPNSIAQRVQYLSVPLMRDVMIPVDREPRLDYCHHDPAPRTEPGP